MAEACLLDGRCAFGERHCGALCFVWVKVPHVPGFLEPASPAGNPGGSACTKCHTGCNLTIFILIYLSTVVSNADLLSRPRLFFYITEVLLQKNLVQGCICCSTFPVCGSGPGCYNIYLVFSR